MSVSTVTNPDHLEAHGEHIVHETSHSPHEAHHDEFVYLDGLNPRPSPWPIMLGLVLFFLPAGLLLNLWGGERFHIVGWASILLGSVLALVPTFGWFHSVIVDKWEGHFGHIAQGKDLALGVKLFFLSEIAVFGSLFAYYFLMRHESMKNHDIGWPLPNSPILDQSYPAIGLIILLTSSVTCEFAHKCLAHGNRARSKDWLLVTSALGLLFLFIQGYEWGFLIRNEGFTVGLNWFGTVFYALTGFHGLHVITGLIMLLIVYGRMEIGHYTKNRHFSMLAASWYWHLVDVVWIFVFTFIYCFQGEHH